MERQVPTSHQVRGTSVAPIGASVPNSTNLNLRSGYGHDKSQAILPYKKLANPPLLFFFGDGVSGVFSYFSIFLFSFYFPAYKWRRSHQPRPTGVVILCHIPIDMRAFPFQTFLLPNMQMSYS